MRSKKKTIRDNRRPGRLWDLWRENLRKQHQPDRHVLLTVIESLEDRMMLTATPANLTTDSVDFFGTALQDDALYLRANGSALEYSETGASNSFTSDLDLSLSGTQTLTLSANAHIEIDLGIGTDRIFIDESLQNALASFGGTIAITSDLTSVDTLAATDGRWNASVDSDALLGGGLARLVGGNDRLAIETTGSLTVNADWSASYDLSLAADQSILVANGVMMSTRQVAAGNDPLRGESMGDSYDITLAAPDIVVGSDAKILSHATDLFVAGDITLDAHGDQTGIDTPLFEVSVVSASAKVHLDGAVIKGGSVNITSVAESSSQFFDDESPATAGLNFLDSISEIGGVAVTHADAQIIVGAGTSIEGTTVGMISRAGTESVVRTLGTALAVAYGESNPQASIVVEDGVDIVSTGSDISIHADANSALIVQAKQGLYPQKSQSSFDITVAAGLADILSSVEIAGGATLTSANAVNIAASMDQSHDVSTKAATYEDGSVGSALTYSKSTSDVHAHMDGTIEAGGAVSIVANSSRTKNDAASAAEVGTGTIASYVIRPENPNTLTKKIFDFMGKNQPKTKQSTGGTTKFAVAAAFTYSDHENQVVARIGDRATVNAMGTIDVQATILDVPEVSAITKVNSQSLADNRPKGNTKENSTSVAVVVSSFDNATEAYIGESAVVETYADVNVVAETVLPFTFEWWQLEEVSDVTDKLNGNLGIQNGLVTSWAQSKATGTKTAIAGSLSFNTFSNSSRAYVAENARVNELKDSDDQHVRVRARNVIETVNLSGLPFSAGQSAGGNGGGGAYLETNYLNNAVAEIRSGALVQGSSLIVSADTRARNIALATSVGSASKFAFNGAGSVASIDNRTIARIDDGALVSTDVGFVGMSYNENDQPLALDTNGDGVVTSDDRDVSAATEVDVQTSLNQFVMAEDDSLLFNFTGGVTKSQSVGVGFSAGVNNVTRSTQALIGNESAAIGDRSFAPGVGVDRLGNIDLGFQHGFATGDVVKYSSGGGVEIQGLRNGAFYVVTVVDGTTVRLEKTNAAATDAPETFFAPAAAVDATGNPEFRNSIQLGYEHNYETGEAIVYRTGGGVAMGGLVDGETYYVVVVDATTIALVDSKLKAELIAVENVFAANQIDDVTSSIDLLETHDFRTGDAVVYSSEGGATIDGLVNGATYFVRVDDAQSIFLAATAEAAQLGNELIELHVDASTGNIHRLRRALRIQLDASVATGETHHFRLHVTPADEAHDAHALMRAVDPSAAVNEEANSIDLGYQHGFADGQAVVYDNGGGDSIGGLASGETYYVIVVNATTIQLADSAIDSAKSNVVSLDPSVATGTTHGIGGAFRDRPAVDSAANTISFGRQHGFSTGDEVTYESGDGVAIGGLEDGETYFVVVIDAWTIQLAATESAATANLPVVIDIDAGAATASDHQLRSANDAEGSISAGGTIRIAALNRGNVTSVSLASARATSAPAGGQKSESKAAAGSKAKAGKGVSVSGDISINRIADTTIASVRDGVVNVDGGASSSDVGVTSTNRSQIFAGSGSVALSSSQSASAGLAGGYSVNEISSETLATIKQAEVATATGDIFVSALSSGEIRSLSASGSGVTRNAALSLAGQVAINKVVFTTDAQVSAGSKLNSERDIELSALDDSLIHAIAGAATFGGKVGFGASIAANRIENQTRAVASNSQITVSGDLSLLAESTGEIRAITAAVGGSKQGMVGEFGVAFNSIDSATIAQLSDVSAAEPVTVGGDLFLGSGNHSVVEAITGGIGAGTTAGIGGGYAENNIRSITTATIDSATALVEGSVDVTASSTALMQTITVGGAGAQSFALGGAVSLNEVCGEVMAAMTDSSITANNTDNINVDLIATNQSTIKAIAGGLAVATSGVSVGAALATNVIESATIAKMDNSSVESSGGAVIVSSDSTALIESITAGGAGAQTFAIGGSVSLNDIRSTVDAHIGNHSAVEATGTVKADATDASTIRSVAGSVAGALGTAAVGVGVATNDIANTIIGFVEESSISAGGFIHVRANSTSLIETITAGAGVSSNEVSGAAALNAIANSIAAYAAKSDLSGDHGVQLHAKDSATIRALAGKAGGAATASIGGAAAFNEVENTIHAYANDSQLQSSGGNAEILAASEATIHSLSASGSIAGTASIAGSIGSQFIGNDVQAYMVDTTANTFGNILVVAESENNVNTYVGAVQLGGTLGFGGSVGVTNLANTTKAFVESSTANAAGHSISQTPASDGSDDRRDVRGLAVVAVSNSDIAGLTANGSGGGTVGIAAAVSVQIIEDTTEAFIIQSTVNEAQSAHAMQSVLVSAANDTEVDIKAGGLGVSGTAGVGATSDTTIITNTTRAFVADASIVNAEDAIDVTTNTESRIHSITISGAFSGAGGLAGNVVVTNVDSTNEAFIDNATLTTTGDIDVTATDEVSIGVRENGDRTGIIAGALGVGLSIAGLGGAVAVNTISNTTLACINDSVVDAGGMLSVEADASEDIVTFAASGAAGLYVGAAASVSVSTIKTDTTAIIVGDTVVNGDASVASSSQNVRISATDDAKIQTLGGSASAGLGALGASVDVSTIKNRVSATLANQVELNADGSLDINAASNHEVDTDVAAGGVGLAGVQGAVSVVNIGSATTGQANEAAPGAGNTVNGQIGGSTVGNQLGSSSTAQRAKARSDAKTDTLSVSDEFDSSAAAFKSTFAAIGAGATVHVGGDIDVQARDRTQIKMTAGAAAAGAVGVGGGVAIANIHNRTTAVVGSGATLLAGGDIDVDASGLIADTDIVAVAGGAGAVGLGAAVAVLNSSNDVSARIINDAVIEKADEVRVNASAVSNLHTDAQGASFGALAAGVMVSDVSEDGSTLASVGDQVSIGMTPQAGSFVNDLTVNATSNHIVNATGTAAAGGLGPSGAGNFSTASLDASTAAQIQSEAKISVRDDIVIATNAINNVDAKAFGVVGSLIIAAGATTATANVKPHVAVSVGPLSELAAGDDITIRARSTHDAYTESTGASGGLATGAIVRANTNLTNDTQIDISQGSQITARDSLDVFAESRIDADSRTESKSIGGATLGDSRANTSVNSDTVVDVAALTELAARVTRIHALATRLDANATAIYNSSISLANIAEANARVDANSLASIISRAADIAGYGRMELVARQTGSATRTNAQVNAGVVPFVSSVSRNDVHLRSNIDVQSGSVLRGSDILVESDSASVADQRLSDVNSITIDTLESLVDGALDVLAAANRALSDANDALQDAKDWLASRRRALNDFIHDNCGGLSGGWYDACVVALYTLTLPYRAAIEAAVLGVSSAQGVVNGAIDTVNAAQRGLTTARNNLAAAFGVELLGAERRTKQVQLNGDLFVGAFADRLVINADGTLSGGATGISGQVVDDAFILNEIAPDDLVTPTTARLIVNASGGTIDGTLRIHEKVGLAALDIVNNFAGESRLGEIVSDSARSIATTVTQNASNRRLSAPKVAGLPTPEMVIRSHGDSNLVVAGNVDAANGTIDVLAVGTIFVEGRLETTGALSVTSALGSILNRATGSHFVAGTLDLSATNGRLGNEFFVLQTRVAGWQTAVALDILAIADLDGGMDIHAASQVAMFLESANRIDGSAMGRDITMVTQGAIGSLDPFVIHTNDGHFWATASEDVELAVSGIMIVEDVTSTLGNVAIASDDHLIVGGTISASGDVTLLSDASIRLVGGTILADLTNGVVGLNAQQDLIMSSSDPIRAYRVDAVAGNDLFLVTDVVTIDAASRFAGGLEIYEVNDITLENVLNLDGAVRIIAKDDIRANVIQSLAATSRSFVGLISQRGDVELGSVFADATDGQISISAAGQIVDSALDEAADATAAVVMMNAGESIAVGVDATELFTFSDDKKIRVKTGRSLELFLETKADVNVTANGDVHATHVKTTSKNIVVKSNDGDVYVSSVSAVNEKGSVRIQANGSEERGNIVQVAAMANGSVGEIVAGKAVDLKAKGRIEMGGMIQAENGNISMNAGSNILIRESATIHSGNLLKISNKTGDIEILGLASAKKNMDVRSRGNLSVSGGIATQEQDVKLRAEDAINLASDSQIQAGDNANLKTRNGDINIFGAVTAGLFASRSTRGDIKIDAGGVANVQGDLDPLGEVLMTERDR